ncbi:hypothetical protein RIF29_19503 [Crotalaria pallida]|uniref:Uncharacterized protein n=1 Tax=Crotalaria pallida TaxID=3830 RepID=A0AAN9IBG7_CROPI
MYPNHQAFSSVSFSDLLSGNSPLLPHNYSESQNEVKLITATGEAVTMQSINGNVPRTQMAIVDNEQNIQCQGLSLSLGTLMPSTASSVLHFSFEFEAIWNGKPEKGFRDIGLDGSKDSEGKSSGPNGSTANPEKGA